MSLLLKDTIDTESYAYRYGFMISNMANQCDMKTIDTIAIFKDRANEKGIGKWKVIELVMKVISLEEKEQPIEPLFMEILEWRKNNFNNKILKAYPYQPPIKPEELFPGYDDKKYVQ